MTHTDAQTQLKTIIRAKEGDVQAFEELVRLHQSYVYALAVRILCNEDEARDILQETFMRVWQHLGQLDPSRKFTTWLYAITTNLCLDALRSSKRRRSLVFSRSMEDDVESLPSEEDLEHLHSTQELITIIRTLTEEMPPTQRLVFVLRDLQDLSVEEVAEISGLSRGSIKTNLHYARRALRAMLKLRYDIEGPQP